MGTETASESEVALLEGFYLYLVKDYPGQLYGGHETEHTSCECKEGFQRVNATACAPTVEPACTEVAISGPATVADPGAQWPHKDEQTMTLSEQMHAAFEDCIIFWDCNSDGMKDVPELACVMQKNGRCTIKKPVYEVDSCIPYYSPLAQTGRNCNANLVIKSDGSVILNVKVSPHDLPCPKIAPIGLEDPPTDTPTAHPTVSPTDAPTPTPTFAPTPAPTDAPTNAPSKTPTVAPKTTCELCGTRSCRTIEVLGFEKDDLTVHQTTDIAFGFDKGLVPGSARDTVADTIGYSTAYTVLIIHCTPYSLYSPYLQRMHLLRDR
jgi:hypothetical protein